MGEHEYFSDGLAEELLNDLAKIQGLRVAARTSSFQFKGKTEDLRTVGEKLNVGNILEGSVRKEGNKVRITAQLIKAADGFSPVVRDLRPGTGRYFHRAGGHCAFGSGIAEGEAAGRNDSNGFRAGQECRRV